MKSFRLGFFSVVFILSFGVSSCGGSDQSHEPSSISVAPTFDSLGRLTFYGGKKLSTCPVQSQEIGVLLVMGQSNSANYGQKNFVTQYPEQVLNYFDGDCYVASSPLLGAGNMYGEFITPLADNLIANGVYKSVIIISSGVGGSELSRWAKGGDLNSIILIEIEKIKRIYKVTDIVWHQGEADFIKNTSSTDYFNLFHSLLASLDEIDVKAPVFISISTKCMDNKNWYRDNSTAIAQRLLIDNKRVFLGADTDLLLIDADRDNGCHFLESGQIKAAEYYADSIKRYSLAK